jgi:A/G-specific adenine glycosylase
MPPAEQLVSHRADFQERLHAWYRRHHRRLPWRDQPTLYKTVVSEFMLQQTQVATALPYFARWLHALPDFAALAAATEERVVKLWEGLGYYSRARNLHRLARSLAARPHAPRRPSEWRELPGVGPYTAAAITSIAFGEPAAVVDGNVVRILARLVGERRLFRDGTAAAKHFGALASALLEGGDPGLHNQAMMELGATVCLRQNPLCPACPVAALCAGRSTGDPTQFPRLAPKAVERRQVARLWCEHDSRLLLRRGPDHARQLAGLHELPEPADLGQPAPPATAPLLAVKRRAITRFQITESIYRATPNAALRRTVAASPVLEWIPLDRLDRIILSGPHRRWITELLAAKGRVPPGTGPSRRVRPGRIQARKGGAH